MNYNLWLNKAKTKIESLPKGTVFVLKNLFFGSDWEKLQVGERLTLGKLFKNAVLDLEIENVAFVGKAENNSAQYKII